MTIHYDSTIITLYTTNTIPITIRNRNITVNDVSKAIGTQKKNKSAGPNGVYMESFMFADVKLHVHICLCLLPVLDIVIFPVFVWNL